MRFLKVWSLNSLALLFWGTFVYGLDPLETLIEAEQETYRQWVFNEDDLPMVFLLGDSNSALIYSSRMDDSSDTQLCYEVSWEELIDHSRLNPLTGQKEINFLSPQLRNTWAATCLIRPNDEIWVIGRERQQKVTINHFAVLSRVSLCDQESDMELRAHFKETIPGDVLFYSTDSSLVEGDNQVEFVPVSPDRSQFSQWQSQLAREVQFIDEYDTSFRVFRADFSSSSIVLCHLKKNDIKEEDIGLPHELVIALSGPQIQVLASEKIRQDEQSGHVYIVETIDFNRDGFPDIVVDGDRNGCFFRRIFIGKELGFDEVLMPLDPCSCP